MGKVIRKKILFYFLFFTVLLSVQSVAQMVTVKMRVNTSTCLDTLKSNHIVLVCGESVKKNTIPTITWDNKTGIAAKNIGGDYWEATFKASPGDEIRFKFVTYFNLSTPTFHWTGWEGPIDAGVSSGDNRMLIVGNNDTTLALQFYNGWESKVKQYWRPFKSKQDTIAVYFRVNMGGTDFNPVTGLVDVRAGLPLGADPTWITIKTLAREINSVNGGSFWSGVAYVAKANVTSGALQKYKYVIQQTNTWENLADRTFIFSSNLIASGDTTIHWNYFNNMPPTGPKVDANILFRLKLDALEKAGLFNEALGDKVGVTGPKGWAPPEPVFDTDPTVLKLTYNSDLEEWNLLEPFSKFPKEVISYKYYIAWDTSRVSPTNPNYIPGLALTNGWEEPGVTGGADRKYIYTTNPEQSLAGDFGAEQQFFNSIPPNGVIENPISVTFKLNMALATSADSNATNPLFRPGIDSVFVQFDGCMVSITQGKTMYGTDNRIELLDPDGDGIYTGTIDLISPTFYQLCYRVTYSNAPGASITNGGGNLLGRRYYQYVHPVSVGQDGTVTWPTSFELSQMEWKASNLTVETPPDLDTPTGVENKNSAHLLVYSLYQNYPNPFNPSTVITYSVPEYARVKIEVYNVLGQKVASLINKEQSTGTHSLVWNAQNDLGSNLATGIYMLKMETGKFIQVKKMLLIR